jgi:hypothetical protein
MRSLLITETMWDLLFRIYDGLDQSYDPAVSDLMDIGFVRVKYRHQVRNYPHWYVVSGYALTEDGIDYVAQRLAMEYADA